MTFRPPLRAAALTALLMVNGCADLLPSVFGYGAAAPGLTVAEAALQGGAGQVALQVSDDILKQDSGNIAAGEIKADALSLLGQYDEATAIYQILLAKDPNSARANIGLGRIKLSTDPAGAEALFQRVLARSPRDLIALNNLGIANDLQGKHVAAQGVYRQALAISPELGSAQVNLALSLAMSGQGTEAIQLLKGKATVPGAPAKIRHDYAVVLAMSGKRAEAERVLAEDLTPEEVRQVLDNLAGNRIQTARELAPGRQEVSRVAEAELRQRVPQIAPPRAETRRFPTASAAPPAGGPAWTAPPPLPAPSLNAPVVTATAPVPMAPPAVIRPPMEAAPAPPPPTAAYIETGRQAGAQAPLDPARETVSRQSPPMPVVQKPAPAPEPVQSNTFFNTGTAAAVMVPSPSPSALGGSVGSPLGDAPDDVRERVRQANAHFDPTAAALERIMRRESGASKMVQFAAVPSEAAAQAFWRTLVGRFPDALGKREPVLIRIERGRMVFWRVRTEGFHSAAEARALCVRMRASRQDCLVTNS